MDLLLDTVCAVDAQGYFVYVSASGEELFGYTPEELCGRNMMELIHPDDRERTRAASTDIKEGRPQVHFENRYVRKNGSVVDIMWSARWSEADQLRLAVARDMTLVKRAERMHAALYQISEAGQTAEGLPALCEHIHQIINELLPVRNFSVLLYDDQRRETSVPYCAGEVANVKACGFIQQSQALTPDSLLARVIEGAEPVLATISTQPDAQPDGSFREWLGVPLCASASRTVIGALIVQGEVDRTQYTRNDQELLQFVSTQIAASIARKQADTQLRYLAGHDPLTDLPNRSLFQDRVKVALSSALRENQNLAILYLDLNDFKQVNDRFGHQAGDSLLRAVATRLTECLRESDTVARMGGDEFTVLLPKIQGASGVSCVIARIRTALALPFEALNEPLTISASIGCALYPEQGQNYDELLRHADQHMYINKAQKLALPQ